MHQVYLSRRNCDGLSSLALLVLLMLAIFVALGMWQLQRKAEKEEILGVAQAHQQRAPEKMPTHLGNYSEWRYRQVTVDGHYLGDEQFLLDNQMRDRQVGYNVLTPFITNEGDVFLVDRGWVQQGALRSELPQIDVTSSIQLVTGTLYTPFSDGLRLGTVDNGGRGWPRVIQYIDYPQLVEVSKKPLLPVVLRLAPESEHGYRRDWTTVAFGPERHLGYAVQWFALAAAMLVILIILVRKKIE